MRWVRVDGRGQIHYSKFSLEREEYGSTVCDKTGVLVPMAEPDGESQVHKACQEFVDGKA